MEINGKSTVSYLVRTPRVPFFMLILIGLEAKNLLAFQGRRGIASVIRCPTMSLRKQNLNKLKTTPTPNKNGPYGIKGGVRMPYIFSVEIP